MNRSMVRIALVCAVGLAAACSRIADEYPGDGGSPGPAKSPVTIESKINNTNSIRMLINVLVQAIRAKDVQGVMSVFSPEVVSFDAGPDLQHGGKNFRDRWQELFDMYEGPISYEVRDLSITVDDDVAFSHSINRISGKLKKGSKSEIWLRWTACYSKVSDRWEIVHEHVSVPVDPKTGRAVLDEGL